MFKLITPAHNKEIAGLANKAGKAELSEFAAGLKKMIEQIRTDIPEKKRISYGRYGIIKQFGFVLYPMFTEAGADTFRFALDLFKDPDYDPFVRSLAIQLISIDGLKSGDKNSYWIAYRACRNLVKKEPIRVMDLLGVDEYCYKQRIHYRKDDV